LNMWLTFAVSVVVRGISKPNGEVDLDDGLVTGRLSLNFGCQNSVRNLDIGPEETTSENTVARTSVSFPHSSNSHQNAS
jgi:hypothetical protein